MISIGRKGAFTSYIVVELCWLWFLWIMWVASAGNVASTVWIGSCGRAKGIIATICGETQAIEAFGFITWFMSTFFYYLVRFRVQFLTFLSFLSSSRSYGVQHHPPHIHRHGTHEGPLQHLDHRGARSRLHRSRRHLCRSALIRGQDGRHWRLAVLWSSRPVSSLQPWYTRQRLHGHPAGSTTTDEPLSPSVNVVENSSRLFIMWSMVEESTGQS